MAVITIFSRYGSGGDEIAIRLSEMLGYQFFDKQLMIQVAEKEGIVPNEIVDSQEDRHQILSLFDRFFGHKVVEAWETIDEQSGARTVEIGEVDSKSFVTALQKIIQVVYERGNVVILGRGGQAILRDCPGVLHVCIEAPFEKRVDHVSELQRFTNPQAARDFVEGRDRAAADYLRAYHNIDWDDPALYHLQINTGRWDVETAACIIADTLKYLRA